MYLRKAWKQMSIKQLFTKYKEIILYLVFGVGSTLTNIFTYWLLAHPLNIDTLVSAAGAWLASIIFAYLTNRKWVFHSQAQEKKEKAKEMGSFLACRVATGLVDLGIMYVFVDVLNFNDLVMKIVSNIIVIILNYVASKLIVFKSKKKKA